MDPSWAYYFIKTFPAAFLGASGWFHGHFQSTDTWGILADTTGLIVKHHQPMRFIKKHPTKRNINRGLFINWLVVDLPSEKYEG